MGWGTGVGGLLDRFVAGDDIDNVFKNLTKFYGDQYTAGSGLEGEGLGDIRGLLARYRSQLDSGESLPASVQKAYDMAGGVLRDTAAQKTTALGAGIRQNAAANGGFMSDEAQQEFKNIGGRGIANEEFGAQTNLGMARAQDELSSTHDLMNRLDSLSGTILNAGQFKEQLGANYQAQQVMNRLSRNKAIFGDITGSMFGKG